MSNYDAVMQAVLITLINVLMPTILVFVFGLGKSLWVKFQASADKEKLAFATEIVRNLVLAAEQNGLKDMLVAEGQAKYDYVIGRAQAELSERGININVKLLADLIESQVHELFKLDTYVEINDIAD